MATITQTFFVDPDVWWHIKQGEYILATRHLPTQDIYSLTLSGKPWFAYEWLGDVLLATMYRLGGMRGLDVLLMVLGSAILIGLYTLAAIRSGNSKAAFVATAAVFVLATVSFNLRPQMLGYLFLVLTFIILERFRMGKRQEVWALPILMLVWVNAHGSWIIGLGVIGVYLAGSLLEFHTGDIEAHRCSYSDRLRLSVVLALCAGATVITPYGTKLAKYPFDVAFSLPLGVANVIEWQPMPFNLMAGKVFLVLLLGFTVLQIAYRFTWRLEEFGLFLFAAAVACMHRRFLLIFVPVFVQMLATILARWVLRYDRDKDRRVLNAIGMAIILGIAVRYFPSQAELLSNVGKTYPVAAVEYLNHYPVPGPMYNTYGFGGYLILTRGPEHKVFMDGRSELYERAGFLADYYKISDISPDALFVLQKYGIQSCLLNHDEALATLLAALPDWRKVYEDPTSVLFVRRNDPPAPRQSAAAGVSGLELETLSAHGNDGGRVALRTVHGAASSRIPKNEEEASWAGN
ncbi:MAG TPA: hypothetical protein VK770_15435 [Candidatus Acidoferrum sp.]|nr:hypothetical protein [Candidatus Acidoferrum sp.]